MLHIILGTLRSGTNLLSQCLNTLGFTPLKDNNLPDANTINQLLLQDLGVSPYTPALPKNWLGSEAATKAQDRIHKLLTSTRHLTDNGSQSTYIEDKLLSRTFPLWRKALEAAHVDYQCLHIIRHPWEVGMSLNQNEGMDFQTAHITWLSYVREALRHCPDQKIITFDQLLADPVSTCYSSLAPLPDNKQLITNNLPALLDHVQPSLKNHHAGNFTEKETFKPYADIYNQLRMGQYSLSAQISENQPAPPAGLNQAQPDCEAKFNLVNRLKETSPQGIQPGWMKTFVSSDSDLIDSLLQALSHSSSQFTINNSQLTGDNHSKITELNASIHLPDSTRHQFPLIEDQWQKLTLPLSSSKALADTAIAFKPLNTQGLVAIASAALWDRASGRELWGLKGKEIFEVHPVSESAVLLPDPDNALLLVTGDEAEITLNGWASLPDCPLELVIWIKATCDLTALHKHFEKRLTPAVRRMDRMVHRAKQAEAQKKWAEAISLWQELQRYAQQEDIKPPQDIESKIRKARLEYTKQCHGNKKYDEAVTALNHLLEDEPGTAIAQVELARNELARQNWHSAIQVSQNILNNKSATIAQAIKALQFTTSAYQSLEENESAIKLLESARFVGINKIETSYLLAKVHKDVGNWTEAAKILEEIMDKAASFFLQLPQAQFAAQILWKSGKLDLGFQILKDAVNTTGMNRDALPQKTQAIYAELERKIEKKDYESTEVSSIFYDQIYSYSEQYTADPHDSVYLPVWEKVLDILKRHNLKKIIDIGCGPGQFAEYILKSIPDVKYIGYDFSRTAIQNAQSRCPDGTFIEKDVLSDDCLQMEDADVYIMLEILEHIDDDLKLLEKIPSTKWTIISVPNFDSFGHVRFFQDESEVRNRYAHFFENYEMRTVSLSGRSKIFLLIGNTGSLLKKKDLTVSNISSKYTYSYILESLSDLGYGIDTNGQGPMHLPMAWAVIAMAAAIHEDSKTATEASNWLIQNPANDHKTGWGLNREWDAFSNGVVNPKDTVYGITTALAVDGLYRTYILTKNKKYIKAAEQALLDYSDYRYDSTDTCFFYYSDQDADQEYNVYNVTAMLMAQYAKIGNCLNNSFFIDLAAKAFSSLSNDYIFDETSIYSKYSDKNNSRNNDLIHSCFIVYSLQEYAKIYPVADKNYIIDCAYNYLYEYVYNDKALEFHIKDVKNKKIDMAKHARSWGIGMFLFLLSRNNKSIYKKVYKSIADYEFSFKKFSYRHGDRIHSPRAVSFLLLGLSNR